MAKPRRCDSAGRSSCYLEFLSSKDTVFGVTSGRQTALQGVDQLNGSTIATVPLQVILDQAMNVQDTLLQNQQQAVNVIDYEQGGLRTNRRVSHRL